MTVNKKTVGAAVKLGVFTAVSVVVTAVLVAIMGHFGSGDKEYNAVFASASLLQKGDDVRVAGVLMGKVQDVEVYDDDKAKVTFTVGEDLPMTTASKVEIRYLNLVGDRYLTVLEGKPGARRLEDGATIPMSRTTPALNLTALYNGFAPLFSALEPKDINDLSMNLVKVLQGEGGTVESLMAHTASLTTAVADRDKLVGKVITNLNEVLGTVDSKHQQLTELHPGAAPLGGWPRRGPRPDRSVDRPRVQPHRVARGPADPGAAAGQVRHRGAAPAGQDPQPAGHVGGPQAGPARPARDAGGPDPHRHVRLLVQLLHLRGVGEHQAPGGAQGHRGAATAGLRPQAHQLPLDGEAVQPVRGLSDRQLARIGVISVVVALMAMAAALNLQKFPGLRGTGYEADFSDASGLHKGNMVQIAGIRVGRVSKIDLAGDHVVVHFTLDPGTEVGEDTAASIEVLNLLGEKFLDLEPAGSERLEAGATIPLDRTDSSYDIVKVFSKLSDTTERIDIPQLQQALTTVAGTMRRSSDEAKVTFDGLSRLSVAIASRDSRDPVAAPARQLRLAAAGRPQG